MSDATIIVWKNPDVRLKDGKISSGKKILIDGQQRITAIQAAVVGQQVVDSTYKKKRITIAFNPIDEVFEVCNPAMLFERNLDGIDVILRIGNYQSPSNHDYGDWWCDCGFSFRMGKMAEIIDYRKDHDALLMPEEVDELANVLTNLLDGESRIASLTDQHSKLRNRVRRGTDPQILSVNRAQRAAITTEITELRKRVKRVQCIRKDTPRLLNLLRAELQAEYELKHPMKNKIKDRSHVAEMER